MKKRDLKNGFSLIEVLVFITILSLFFITAISVSVFTMHNLRISQQRIYATQYASEMNEWLLAEKETNWSDFYNHAYDIKNRVNSDGCALFDSQDISWNSLVYNCSHPPSGTPKLDNTFFRKVTFTDVSQARITLNISVEWTDRQVYKVPVTAVYTPE